VHLRIYYISLLAVFRGHQVRGRFRCSLFMIRHFFMLFISLGAWSGWFFTPQGIVPLVCCDIIVFCFLCIFVWISMYSFKINKWWYSFVLAINDLWDQTLTQMYSSPRTDGEEGKDIWPKNIMGLPTKKPIKNMGKNSALYPNGYTHS